MGKLLNGEFIRNNMHRYDLGTIRGVITASTGHSSVFVFMDGRDLLIITTESRCNQSSI